MNTRGITELGGILTGVATAAVSTLYCPAIIGTIVGGLSIELAGNMAGNFDSKRFKQLLKKPHPDDLNHDLQIAFIRANIMAIDNIERLYRDAVQNDSLRKNARFFCKELKKDIKNNFQSNLSKVNEDELDTYINKNTEDVSSNLLDKLNVNTKPYKLDKTFIEIFHKNYLSQVQLCFGEILKEPNNKESERAWRAWQKWMSEEIRADIKNIHTRLDKLSEQQQPVELPDLSDEQLNKLNKLSEDLKNPLTLEEKFEAALNGSLEKLNSKVDTLLEESKEILRLNVEIYRTVTDFDSKLETRWFSRKSVWLWALVSTALVVTVAIYFYYNSQPFSTSFKVHGFQKPDYMPLENRGAVELTLGDEKKIAEINKNGIADFKQIPANFKNEPIKVAIVKTEGESYRIQPKDTVILKSGAVIKLSVLQEGLDRLFGTVKDETGDYLQGVIVRRLGLIDTTNTTGDFFLHIPPEKQTRFAAISFFKEGYKVKEFNDVPVQTDEPMKVLLSRKEMGENL